MKKVIGGYHVFLPGAEFPKEARSDSMKSEIPERKRSKMLRDAVGDQPPLTRDQIKKGVFALLSGFVAMVAYVLAYRYHVLT